MASLALIRMGGLAAMLGGTLWALWYVGASLVGSGAYETFNRLMPAVLVLLAVGLLAFYAVQNASHGWVGRVGFVVAVVGLVVMIAGNMVEFWTFSEEAYGPDSLRNSAWMAFGLGLFTFYIGTVLFGVDTLRAGELPRFGALLLLIWFPVGLVVSNLLQLVGVPEGLAFSGLTGLLGVGWVVLGYAVWSGGSGAARRTPRVR